jgi:hypothetical protein
VPGDDCRGQQDIFWKLTVIWAHEKKRKGKVNWKIEVAKHHCLKMAQNDRDSVHEAQSSECEEVAKSGVAALAGSLFSHW